MGLRDGVTPCSSLLVAARLGSSLELCHEVEYSDQEGGEVSEGQERWEREVGVP